MLNITNLSADYGGKPALEEINLTLDSGELLVGVRPNGLEDTPQYKIDIDQEKAQALGVSISDINTTLGAAWGGS